MVAFSGDIASCQQTRSDEHISHFAQNPGSVRHRQFEFGHIGAAASSVLSVAAGSIRRKNKVRAKLAVFVSF